MKRSIAKVHIQYADGKAESAVLKAEYNFNKDELAQLLHDGLPVHTEDCDQVKQLAETILASYFSGMTEIELADREKFKITSEVKDCKYTMQGTVLSCDIEFFLEEL